ncbi:MAG: hypothetical protein ABID40_01170 [Candidatus Bipolaricaulota bacterium]
MKGIKEKLKAGAAAVTAALARSPEVPFDDAPELILFAGTLAELFAAHPDALGVVARDGTVVVPSRPLQPDVGRIRDLVHAEAPTPKPVWRWVEDLESELSSAADLLAEVMGDIDDVKDTLRLALDSALALLVKDQPVAARAVLEQAVEE